MPLEMRDPFLNMAPGMSYLSVPIKIGLLALRIYKKIKIYLEDEPNKESLAKKAFFGVLIEYNETAERTFIAAALILNIQKTLIQHIELEEACREIKDTACNKFPYTDRRTWDMMDDFSHYYRSPWDKLKKLIDRIGEMVKKIFILCATYLTTYDLCVGGGSGVDWYRAEAIHEVCKDPWQVLSQFQDNQIKLNNLLKKSEYTDWIKKVLNKYDFESIDTLKQTVLTILEKPQKVINTLDIIKDLTITNPSRALDIKNRKYYQSKHKKMKEKLGLIEMDKSDELKRYPPYIGPRLPNEKDYKSYLSENSLIICKTPEKRIDNILSSPSKLLSSPVLNMMIKKVTDVRNNIYNTLYDLTEQLFTNESDRPIKKLEFGDDDE